MRDIIPGLPSEDVRKDFPPVGLRVLDRTGTGGRVRYDQQTFSVQSHGTESFRGNKEVKRKWGRWFFCGVVIFVTVVLVWQWKIALMERGEQGYAALEEAARALKSRDRVHAEQKLREASERFESGSRLLFGAQYGLPVIEKIPGTGFLTSGIALMKAGEHLATGAQELAGFLNQSLSHIETKEQPSLLEILKSGEKNLIRGNDEIQKALKLLQYVHPESLPEDKQDPFRKGEALLPVLAHTLNLSVTHLDLLNELLGGNGPRLYLFLFQNNHELRPTGGFIGSYGILEMQSGMVRRFFVDGIFNPDGQLKENIVPPAPIQKISTGWSLHDSNWFPNFPTSAEKARFFYEKTGGPTTDGVVAMTPEVLERVLRILGPVDLPEYGATIDADNFIPLIQEEVEVNYDKEENNPKKILGDLTGVLIRRLVEKPGPDVLLGLGDVLVNLLNERHILLFARDDRAQNLIRSSGWSGEMLNTPYDYLSVIHTNINGFKTDGVVKDNIRHQVSIQGDGSVIDTVSITRVHAGGNTPYEWWNKVNANYMRVYVPLGSELLSASGMTREVNVSPVDYDALRFRRDEEVVDEEGRIRIDSESGTRIGEEFGKTVFGNWVYVSPGEQVTVVYRYKLPFRLALEDELSDPLPFSILYQKQAGTTGWQLSTEIEHPDERRVIWQSAENLIPYGRILKQETNLDRNVFLGLVLQ
jgi:hypothetical protein